MEGIIIFERLLYSPNLIHLPNTKYQKLSSWLQRATINHLVQITPQILGRVCNHSVFIFGMLYWTRIRSEALRITDVEVPSPVCGFECILRVRRRCPSSWNIGGGKGVSQAPVILEPAETMIISASVIYSPEYVGIAEPLARFAADRIVHYHFVVGCTTLDPMNINKVGNTFTATSGPVNLSDVPHIFAHLLLLVRAELTGESATSVIDHTWLDILEASVVDSVVEFLTRDLTGLD